MWLHNHFIQLDELCRERSAPSKQLAQVSVAYPVGILADLERLHNGVRTCKDPNANGRPALSASIA